MNISNRPLISRRDFMRKATIVAGVATGGSWGPLTNGSRLCGGDEVLLPEHDELAPDVIVASIPFLPSDESMAIEYVNSLTPYEDGRLQWDKLVTPRVFIPRRMNAEVAPSNVDRFSSLAEAVDEYAAKRGWIDDNDSYGAWKQVFCYPATLLTGDETILKQGKGVRRWSDGNQIFVDAIQPINYEIVTAPVYTRDMVIGVYPNETGIIRARIVPGSTKGEIALAFAKNKNREGLGQYDESGRMVGDVPAIHVDGNPGAPVRIRYYLPDVGVVGPTLNDQFKQIVVDTRLSLNTGVLSVHLPAESDLYHGSFAPAVSIQMLAWANSQHGETEVTFRMGTDDNSLGKNRVLSPGNTDVLG